MFASRVITITQVENFKRAHRTREQQVENPITKTASSSVPFTSLGEQCEPPLAQQCRNVGFTVGNAAFRKFPKKICQPLLSGYYFNLTTLHFYFVTPLMLDFRNVS